MLGSVVDELFRFSLHAYDGASSIQTLMSLGRPGLVIFLIDESCNIVCSSFN